ncbi:ATP-binding protein [Massilia sp. BSC265]|uniref:hybrid sensor histidine kinase/response regulator n=1 Tax=Massilia sp. BSC265 TaxID=1549812 RepID=UPI00068B51C8|nr:ATP-binding protein [Massilia sp. BSC265]
MKTRTYLAAIVLTVLVPLLALSAWGLHLLLEEEKESRLLTVEARARSIALSIDKELVRAEGALRVIGQTDLMSREDFPSLYKLMGKTITSPDSWAVLYDADGRMLMHTHHPYGTSFDEGPNTWVPQAIALGKPSVSNLREGRAGKWKVVSVNLPVKSAGGRQFLMSHTFHVSHLTALLHRAELPPTWVVGVFGDDGISIARNLREKEFVGKPVKPELYEASRKRTSGRIKNMTRDGFMAYNTFTHTTRADWTVAVAAPEEDINRPARTATFIAACVLLFALGSALLGIALFARRLTSSFDLALNAAKSLENGKIPVFQPSRVVEADVLQRALHEAGVKLEAENQARQRLEREREQLLRSEREARRAAENQNSAKDEFLAMLAHELRNPLAPIVAAAHMLRLPGRDEASVQRTGDIIIRQADHLKSLIHDLLDVSRVTRGLVSIDQHPVNIGAVVTSAVEQAQPLLDSRRHELVVDMRSPEAVVLGDKKRLVQVVVNLLNNAAKYTPPGGKVSLSAETREGQLVLAVSDNGLGIEPELLPQVFDLFRQARRTADRSQGGLGLGLALVRSIMTLHGGQVSGHSEGIGKGACFTLTLPLHAGEAQARVPLDAARGQAERVPLMIVDDNVDAARTLANLLEAKGHKVVVMANAHSALDESSRKPLPLYILDIGLPDIDGYELARRLRALPGTAGAVLVALTGYGQMHDQEMAFAAGFDHHFVKPIDIAALDRILAEIAQARAGQAICD